MMRYRHWFAGAFVACAVFGLVLPAHAVADNKLTPAPADLNKYLPNDTGAMVRINFQQLQQSELLKPVVAHLKDQLKKGQKQLEALGFDPLKDLGTFTLAGPLTMKPEKYLVIITGKFDAEKFQKAAKDAAEKSNGALKITKYGKYTVWEVTPPNTRPPMPETFYQAIVDENTILISGGKTTIHEAIDKASGKKKTMLNKDIAPLIPKTDTKEGFSLLVTSGSIVNLANELAKAEGLPEMVKGVAGKVKEGAEKYTFLRFGVLATKDVKLRYAIGTESEDKAKETATEITNGIDQVKSLLPAALLFVKDPQQQKFMRPAIKLVDEVLDTAKVSPKGKTVKVELTITKKVIEQAKEEAMKAKNQQEKKENKEDE
jgi:hypothetical protein